MPNPLLLDIQITQVTAYIMSLRNQTKAPAGHCRAEIVRLETTLGGRGNLQIGRIGHDLSMVLDDQASHRHGDHATR